MTQESRLARAARRTAGEVAQLFIKSIEQLEPLEARERDGSWLAFYPEDRVQLEDRADKGTTRIAKRLDKAERSLHRTGDSKLQFRYIDREIVALRQPGAVFTGKLKGETTRSAPRLDLLLEAADGTPIVGEVKVADDKDPYFGLIQALMHTAHLATANQVARLGNVELRRRFSHEPRAPFDVYVVLEDFDPKKGKYRPRLYDRARELGDELIYGGELQQWVRQVACLDATVTEPAVTFKARWRAGR